jgi:hypothetical protein
MLLDGQKIENTLYFNKIGGFTLADAVSLGGDLLTWWASLYSVPLSTNISLREIYITDLSSATGFTTTQPAPVPAPTGDINTESMPNAVALAVSFRTALRGRSFRGRNYVSGITIDGVIINTVTSTVLASIVAAYEGLFTIASAAGLTWVVVSRFSGVDSLGKPIPRTSGIATEIQAVLIVDATVDSQRRRAPGRGQ